MKKLLVLLALCMVLAVMFVACNNEPETPVEDTTAGTTEAPTTESTTEAPTTETQAPTTEETTEAPTTETQAPTTETTTEEETTTEAPDPAEPVYFAGAADLATILPAGSGIAGAEQLSENGIDFVRVTVNSGDPQANFGNLGVVPQYLAIVYRTTADQDAEMFIGTSNGPNGTNDHVALDWNNDGNWHILVVDLANCSSTNITDGNVGYFRLDPFRGATEGYVDIAYIGFYNTAKYATDAFFANIATIVPAADMASSIPGSPGINGATLSADGTFVTIDTIGQGDPYYQLPMLNQKGIVAKYVAIKYRTTSTSYTISEIFVGSGAGPNGQGDNIRFDLNCDGNWNLAVIDLSEATAVVDGVVNYLRWDPFAGNADATIDMAYIGLFTSYEDIFAYDETVADIYRDVPNHADVTVELGNRTDGGPYSGVKTFGQKLPLGENFLKQITIKNMATYADGNTNTWALKIWAWNTDYATTVAGNPLYVITGENHQDNQDFVVDVPAKLLISGDVYYELEYLTGSAQFTGWAAESILVEGVETYVAGELKEGTYASFVVVGVELPPVETIYYDGENGTTTVPVQGVKYVVRGAAGKTLTIENAGNFIITADNQMGTSVLLKPNVMGKVEVEVPEDWFTFELIIENVCGEPAEFSMTIGAAGESNGSPDAPFVMEGTEGSISVEFISGFESIFYSYTATENGFVLFEGTDNFSVFIEDATGATWLGDGYASYEVVAGETYKFFICEAFWTAGTAEGIWEFVTEMPSVTVVPPVWSENKDIVTHQSFDQLYTGTANANNGPENVFTPGQATTWNQVADLSATGADALTYWGWIGVKGTVGQFGYMIDEGEMIFDDAWTWATEDAVVNAAKPTGADTASRMKISIDLTGLTGNHYVHVLYKNADGDMVVLGEFVVMLPEA